MPHTYHVYGVALRSEWTLPCPRQRTESVAKVTLVRAAAGVFANAAKGIVEPPQGHPVYRSLGDGFVYFRWDRHFEFLVSPSGRRISARPLRRVAAAGFDSYLLGPALSFALIKQGIEPLHATTVVVDGEAIGILGDSGYGKSTLAAWFVRSGGRLLTDDLQVIGVHNGRMLAYSGPPRIKLLRVAAAKILHGQTAAVLSSPFAPKLVVTLTPGQCCSGPVPLRALYVLNAPAHAASGTRITLRRLSARQAFLELVRNTFNTTIVDRDRLQRQLSWCAHLASTIPLIRVSYPRRWQLLPAVRRSILDDLSRGPVLAPHV